jgi:polyphosphate kinase 2 (PPK2 family)
VATQLSIFLAALVGHSWLNVGDRHVAIAHKQARRFGFRREEPESRFSTKKSDQASMDIWQP